LIKEAIEDYLQKRTNETEYLQTMKDIMEAVLSRTDSSIPSSLEDKEVARAFFGVSVEQFSDFSDNKDLVASISEELALKADEIILELRQVDWYKSVDIPKKMIFLIGDYIIDHIRDVHDLKLSFKDIDTIAERIVEIAKIRYK